MMKTMFRILKFLPMLLLTSCAAVRERPLDLDNRDFSITTGPHAFRGGRPLVTVAQGERRFPALADTGATRSLVAVPDAVHREAARTAGTEWIGAQGDPLEGVPVTLRINATTHPGFAIAESKVPWSGQFPMILGLDVLREHDVVFDYRNRSTRWSIPTSSRRTSRAAPALFVLPSRKDDPWIILDTGAVNSYYLNASEPLEWDATNGLSLRLVEASRISRDMQSGKKRVGVLGMERQRRAFDTFSAANGMATKALP